MRLLKGASELVGRFVVTAVLGFAVALAFSSVTVAPELAFAKDVESSAAVTAGQVADASSSAAASSKSAVAKKKPTVEQKLAKVNLQVRAKLQYDGWQPAVKSGKTAGTKTMQGFRMLRAKLTGLNGVSGSIRYMTYVPGSGWSKLAKNGAASGSNKRAITAVRVSLRGTVAKYYDVYYRTYFKGFGWLGWAKNSQKSGIKGQFSYVNAMQIKLMKKSAKFKGSTASHYLANRWQAVEHKYRNSDTVNEILEVKYQGGSKAKVVLRERGGSKWKTVVSCNGYVGQRGVGETREGLSRTPSGDFGITDAFGIKPDPGASLNYVRVNSSMYWCGDSSYYNQLININKHPHYCTGEHLIDYSPHYDYGLFFDYNTHPIRYGKGSAFFVHCMGGTPYTGGCIAVSKQNMIKIIRNVSEGARICIY